MKNLNYYILFQIIVWGIFGIDVKGSWNPKTDGMIVSGELKKWHTVTLTFDGPECSETDEYNPFLNYLLNVTFTHCETGRSFKVPGYFAADGNAGMTSASSGNKWRVHFIPDEIGDWNFSVDFKKGRSIAVNSSLEYASNGGFMDGASGKFTVVESDKSGRDFRARGILQYVGKRYLQFSGSGEYFLKAGPDSPETLLGYTDFDNTIAKKEKVPLKTYAPHIKDWQEGDPAWHGDKGKGLIGALNYLASKGVNSISFIPYNAGGDGDNVWPFISRNDKLHYDCSKLEQWDIIFSHAQKLGIHLHFKLQETENDDERKRNGDSIVNISSKSDGSLPVPEALDGGELGPERKLYLREIIARFGYHLALNWNLGEENTQTTDEQCAMAKYIRETDPYFHNIVLHTYPNMQEKIYLPLLGNRSELTGASLQNNWNVVHERTVKWVKASEESGKPWIIANDEQGPANYGVPPDPNYQAFGGNGAIGDEEYDLNDIRRFTLWGNLMAGGAGVEYYFGYSLPQNDLLAEDFRSRDKSWDYCHFALQFFKDEKIPFWEMENADELVGNFSNDNSVYCLAKRCEIYLVYLPMGGKTQLDLTAVAGKYNLSWFNPIDGSVLESETVINGGETVLLMARSENSDWLAVVRRMKY